MWTPGRVGRGQTISQQRRTSDSVLPALYTLSILLSLSQGYCQGGHQRKVSRVTQLLQPNIFPSGQFFGTLDRFCDQQFGLKVWSPWIKNLKMPWLGWEPCWLLFLALCPSILITWSIWKMVLVLECVHLKDFSSLNQFLLRLFVKDLLLMRQRTAVKAKLSDDMHNILWRMKNYHLVPPRIVQPTEISNIKISSRDVSSNITLWFVKKYIVFTIIFQIARYLLGLSKW